MSYNKRFTAFISSELSKLDYIFIDVPQNYPPTKYNSEFWRGITFLDIFQNIESGTILIWATVDILPQLLCGFIESSYDLKSVIPYMKLTRHEDPLYSIDNGFRRGLEYLVVFQKDDNIPSYLFTKRAILEIENELTSKPIRWEDNMFMNLTERGYKGVYILPDGNVADTSIYSKHEEGKMNKYKLF